MYIFECNQDTFEECKSKNLFGASRNANWALEVRKGDKCFLYYCSSPHTIYGVWEATSDGHQNLDPNNFSGERPNQVKVTLISKEIQSTSRQSVREFIVGSDGRVKNKLSTESAKGLFDYLNSIEKASVLASLQPEIEDYRNKYPAKCRCTDGHYVRSRSEQSIDDWFAKNRIYHEYEPVVYFPNSSQFIPDFRIYDPNNEPVYVEFWGRLDDEGYKKNAERKLKIYEEIKLSRIDIYPKDLDTNLDLCMYEKLKKYGIVI